MKKPFFVSLHTRYISLLFFFFGFVIVSLLLLVSGLFTQQAKALYDGTDVLSNYTSSVNDDIYSTHTISVTFDSSPSEGDTVEISLPDFSCYEVSETDFTTASYGWSVVSDSFVDYLCTISFVAGSSANQTLVIDVGADPGYYGIVNPWYDDTFYVTVTASSEYEYDNPINIPVEIVPPPHFSGSGGGVVGNPYQITNCVQLQEMELDTHAYYRIENSFNCTDSQYWNDGNGFKPIEYFYGSLIGNASYTISNLYIKQASTSTNNVGLIGYEGWGAYISAIHITNLNIVLNSGVYTGVGGLVGSMYNSNIANSSVTGSIVCSSAGLCSGSSYTRIGGLVGTVSGDVDITGCSADVDITLPNEGGLRNIGGFIGATPNNPYYYPSNLTIENSTASGNISIGGGFSEIGGFIGLMTGTSEITGSSSSGEISATSAGSVYNMYPGRVGGFVGFIGVPFDEMFTGNGYTQSITNSYSTSDLTDLSGSGFFGGFVGELYSISPMGTANHVIVDKCWSLGDVSSGWSVGGFAGMLYSDGISSITISNTYSRGDVHESTNTYSLTGGYIAHYYNENSLSTISNSYSTGAPTTDDPSPVHIGGFAAVDEQNRGNITNSYWDTQTSGIGTSFGGTGHTTTQMKNQSDYSGWNFTTIWKLDSGINDGYPTICEGSCSGITPTPEPTSTPGPTSTPTPGPTSTPGPSPTSEPTPVPTSTPSPSSTPTPSVSPIPDVVQIEWPKTWGSSNNHEYGYITKTDPFGYVYTYGAFQGTIDFNTGTGIDSHTSIDGMDTFLTKYTVGGDFVSTITIGGTSTNSPDGMSIDANGNVYMVGYLIGTEDLDGTSGVDNFTSPGIYISKYLANGSYSWSRKIGGNLAPNDIFADANGNVYVYGSFYETVNFDGTGGTDNHTSVGDRDVFITKYLSNGSYDWTRTIGDELYDEPGDVHVDQSGNVIITGQFTGRVNFNTTGGVDYHTSNSDSKDIFISKYTSTGAYIWTQTFGGTGDEYPNGLELDSAGNILVTGEFPGTVNFNGTGGTDNHTSNGDSDIFVTKYMSNGSYGWTKTFGGTGYDAGYNIAINAKNSIFITGTFSDTVDFNPFSGIDNHTSNGLGDIFITQFHPDGSYSWTKTFGGAGNDDATGLDVSLPNTIFLSGGFENTVNFSTTGGVNNRTSNGYDDAYLMKLSVSDFYTPISDTLTRLKANTPSDHLIRFGTADNLTDNTDSIVVDFSSSWNLASLTVDDLDLLDDGANVPLVTGDATENNWGVVIDDINGKITLTAPANGSTSGYIAADSELQLKIGTNATYDETPGVNQITNPVTANLYEVSITIDSPSGTQDGQFTVPIVDSDQVNITGYVNAFMTFDIDTGTTDNVDCASGVCKLHGGVGAAVGDNYTVDLGELKSTYINASRTDEVMHSDGIQGAINSIYFDLSTNANGGAVVDVTSATNNGLVGPSSNITPVTDGSTIATNSGKYGFNVSASERIAGGTIVTNSSCNATHPTWYCGPTTSSKEVFNTSGVPVDTARVRMDIAAAAAYTNTPGSYTDTLTFVATAAF